MRSRLLACCYSLVLLALLSGCGGGDLEKEVNALQAEATKVKDEKSYLDFMMKANGLSERIRSSKHEKSLQLHFKLSQIILDAGKNANPTKKGGN